jgi:hypothetical protein
MPNQAGIPTGAYELVRVSTPLDPAPSGPVNDGGLVIPDKRIFLANKNGNDLVVPASTQRASALLPSVVEKKYAVRTYKDDHTVSFTIPQRGSLATAIHDATEACESTKRLPPLEDYELARLDARPILRQQVASPRTIHICSFVPQTNKLHGEALTKYLRNREVIVPAIEELITCCAIYYAVTGRHLIAYGCFTKAHNGAIELQGGQIRIHLNRLERFDNHKGLAVAGVVQAGKQTATTSTWQKIIRWANSAMG